MRWTTKVCGLACGAGRYRLGPEIARMATTVRRSVVVDLHPFIEELSRELEETVDLSILDGDRATFVDQVVSPHRLRAISAVGSRFRCTAAPTARRCWPACRPRSRPLLCRVD